jgi:colicin import membrane protein
MTQAPNLDFVPNVEMTNAPNLVRPNTMRQLRARAEFHARMANLEAKIKAEEKARERAIKNAVKKAAAKKAEEKARETAIKNAAKRAEENARREAVNRSKAEATAAKAAARAKREKSNRNIAAAKKAAENAKKAAENAEKAKKAKKAQANALVRIVNKKWSNIKSSTMTRNQKKKMGKKIYYTTAPKLHPNRGGNTQAFQVFSNAYDKFKTYVNRN